MVKCNVLLLVIIVHCLGFNFASLYNKNVIYVSDIVSDFLSFWNMFYSKFCEKILAAMRKNDVSTR
jgi:hypothetical protein